MNENVRKVFNMLGVEPNEKFKIEGYYDGTFYFDQQLILHNKYDYQTGFGLQSFINGNFKIIKLPKEPKTKKLRDLTGEEFEKWKDKKCRVSTPEKCNGCPFENVICNLGNGCWLNHKDLYSDKFLDQEIEVEE